MTTNRHRTALYPGTFDPITNGHISLIERACHLFDVVKVAVAKSGSKHPLFTFEERVELVQSSIKEVECASQVIVIGFEGLLADLAKQHKADAIIRGLRAVSDFEYEFQMALMNRKIARDIETVFLMPSLSWVYLSSSLVKDVARHKGDVSELVPATVNDAIIKKLSTK